MSEINFYAFISNGLTLSKINLDVFSLDVLTVSKIISDVFTLSVSNFVKKNLDVFVSKGLTLSKIILDVFTFQKNFLAKTKFGCIEGSRKPFDNLDYRVSQYKLFHIFMEILLFYFNHKEMVFFHYINILRICIERHTLK